MTEHAAKQDQSVFGTKYKTPEFLTSMLLVKKDMFCVNLTVEMLVRSEIARNAWPKMVIDFREKKISDQAR